MSADEHEHAATEHHCQSSMHQKDRSLQVHMEMLLLINKFDSSNTESPLALYSVHSHSTADNECFMRTHRHKDCIATLLHCP